MYLLLVKALLLLSGYKAADALGPGEFLKLGNGKEVFVKTHHTFVRIILDISENSVFLQSNLHYMMNHS